MARYCSILLSPQRAKGRFPSAIVNKGMGVMKYHLFCALWIGILSGSFVLLASRSVEAADSNSASHVSYTFPYTPLTYGAPVVQVKINDSVTGNFLIDTGSSANLITDALVDKLGLKPQPIAQGKTPFLLDGKPASSVSSLNLQIGSLKLNGGVYFVIKAKSLSSFMKQPIDGIISMQILRYFALDIDFAHHKITMWFPNALPEDVVKQAGFEGAFVVPLSANVPDDVLYDPVKAVVDADAYWRLLYFVPVEINDGVKTAHESLLLDSGNAATILPSEVSFLLKLKPFGVQAIPNLLSVSQPVEEVQVPTFQSGNLCLLNHTVGYYQKGNVGNTPVLGLDVLSGYHVLIDFGAKKMYLQSSLSAVVKQKLLLGGSSATTGSKSK